MCPMARTRADSPIPEPSLACVGNSWDDQRAGLTTSLSRLTGLAAALLLGSGISGFTGGAAAVTTPGKATCEGVVEASFRASSGQYSATFSGGNASRGVRREPGS